jgi:tRNA U34 5-carboxymethylaminomethyl modifying GTPase MnmE/TrmE
MAYTIAVCGTPYVGKRSLLVTLGELVGSPAFRPEERSDSSPNLFLLIPWHQTSIHCVTRSGVCGDFDPMAYQVLVNAQAVIYVLDAVYTTGGRPNLSDETHLRYLEAYLYHATTLGVGWAQVPWLLVVNKQDLATGVPAEANRFPTAIQANLVRTCATQGIGLEAVWNWMQAVATQAITSTKGAV